MKRVLISISFFILLLPAISWGQLLQWNTYSNVGTETTEPSVYNDSKISTSNLTQGSITAAANSNRFGGSGWFNTGNNASGNTLAEAIVGNDYIQFVVTPNSGYSFTPTSFVFQWEYSGTGPKNVALRSSIDNYASNIGALEPATSGASNTITISGLTALTTATTFRLFGYGATGTGGTGGFDVSSNTVNVQLNGTTVAVGTPMISCSVSSLTDFGVLAAGSTSSEKSFTVSGSNLTDNIIITAPTDFEVSTTIGSGFGSSVSLTQSSGSVSTTSIYVRFAPSSKGSKSGNITNVSNGATTQNVSVSGKANLATNVVIAEIYAGGGNGSATYTNDYVVLYNPTGSSVDLSAYSIQYAGASSSEYAITNLGGSISSNSYYLIQEYSPTNPDGSHLPVTPNIIGTINFATAGGKVALVNSQTKISGKSDSYVVDFVGYGSANESETSAATSLSNTSSIRRKDNSGGSTYGSNGSGYDSDNNSTDFYEETSLLTNAPLPVELTTFTYGGSRA